MPSFRTLLLALLVTAGPACSSSTTAVLTFQLDCSVAAERLQRIVIYIEPADGGALPGLAAGLYRFEDDILVQSRDIDADGLDEYQLTLFSNRFELASGLRIRIRAGDDPGPYRMRVVAGDFENHQIAQGPDRQGRFIPLSFVKGEELELQIPLTCICVGLPACGGSCDGSPEDCTPAPLDGRLERLCGDELGGPDDSAQDCADQECWDRPGCRCSGSDPDCPCSLDPECRCSDEICDDQLDNDCDGDKDCSDRDCDRALACPGCSDEDCSRDDDEDLEHDDDEDCDGQIDCADRDCRFIERCRACFNPVPEICDDAQDNDCDLLADCRDPDCPAPDPPVPEQACTNGFDDDCDGLADCRDSDCEPFCCQQGDENCANGLDDDCDHLVDCEDPFCLQHLQAEDTIERCSDYADNDCDGSIDCRDAGCSNLPVIEDCTNGFDDNCDGRVDCQDTFACGHLSAEAMCFDEIDNDCDGFEDCSDSDCRAPEVDRCSDSRDNDCDGLVDCSDPDCLLDPECAGCGPESCSNGVSDDCDPWIDCADIDCFEFCSAG